VKIFRMIIRSIRDGFKSVFRNFSLSLASISCITITLIIVGLAIIASRNVENFTEVIEKDLTIVAFVDNDATKENEELIEDEFKKISNIESYKYISKDETKESMSQESDVLGTVLDGFDESDMPLKDTYEIKVKDVNHIADTAKEIEEIEKINSVKYGAGMVDKMIVAFDAIEKVTYIIVIALVIVTVFLIINTIKLTISARKREIFIMRLVGASNFTIKTPFIIEGMILGMLGSIVPIAIVIYGYPKFYYHFDGYLYSKLIKLVTPTPFIYDISIIILILGILVGMVGSASASRKYLKI